MIQPQVRNTKHERIRSLLQRVYDLKTSGRREGGHGFIAVAINLPIVLVDIVNFASDNREF